MSIIKRCSNVVHLDLSQNEITSKGVKKVFKSLMSNTSLISLSIGNHENIQKNKIGQKGIPKLSALLKTSQVLQFLDVRGTVLCDPGIIELCEGLKNNKTLLVLNISKNDITVSGVQTL